MTGFRFSPRAHADIEEIWDYTARRCGVKQAGIYIRQIHEAVEMAAAVPNLTQSRDLIRTGYKSYPAESQSSFSA